MIPIIEVFLVVVLVIVSLLIVLLLPSWVVKPDLNSYGQWLINPGKCIRGKKETIYTCVQNKFNGRGCSSELLPDSLKYLGDNIYGTYTYTQDCKNSSSSSVWKKESTSDCQINTNSPFTGPSIKTTFKCTATGLNPNIFANNCELFKWDSYNNGYIPVWSVADVGEERNVYLPCSDGTEEDYSGSWVYLLPSVFDSSDKDTLLNPDDVNYSIGPNNFTPGQRYSPLSSCSNNEPLMEGNYLSPIACISGDYIYIPSDGADVNPSKIDPIRGTSFKGCNDPVGLNRDRSCRKILPYNGSVNPLDIVSQCWAIISVDKILDGSDENIILGLENLPSFSILDKPNSINNYNPSFEFTGLSPLNSTRLMTYRAEIEGCSSQDVAMSSSLIFYPGVRTVVSSSGNDLIIDGILGLSISGSYPGWLQLNNNNILNWVQSKAYTTTPGFNSDSASTLRCNYTNFVLAGVSGIDAFDSDSGIVARFELNMTTTAGSPLYVLNSEDNITTLSNTYVYFFDPNSQYISTIKNSCNFNNTLN